MDASRACDIEFRDDSSGYSLMIDDDGRVAYAYLIGIDGKISADVWLYNRCETPLEPEWRSPEGMPFLNSVDYVDEGLEFSRPSSSSQFSADWLVQDERVSVKILLDCVVIAKLTEGVRPGWSRLAKKDGPLAKVLEMS